MKRLEQSDAIYRAELLLSGRLKVNLKIRTSALLLSHKFVGLLIMIEKDENRELENGIHGYGISSMPRRLISSDPRYILRHDRETNITGTYTACIK